MSYLDAFVSLVILTGKWRIRFCWSCWKSSGNYWFAICDKYWS